MRHFAVLLPFALAACSQPPPTVTQAPPAMAAVEPPPPAAAPMAPAATTQPANFSGYGGATFGMDEASVRAAYGGTFVDTPANEGCYLLWPSTAASPPESAFMFEAGKFVRYSTTSAAEAAPGGGKVGMNEAQIDALYGDAVEKQPRKYVDGKYLRIEDAAGGSGVLIFETDDAQGSKVTSWRVGVEPQIDYVEGCG